MTDYETLAENRNRAQRQRALNDALQSTTAPLGVDIDPGRTVYAQPKPLKETPAQKNARRITHAYEHKLEKAKERIAKLKTQVKKRKTDLTLKQHRNRTQKLVNKVVRTRDAHEHCISCGRTSTPVWQAGHFWSQGVHGALRYDLDNIHKQCDSCNRFEHGNINNYRLALKTKIGQARIDILDAKAHENKNWTHEELHTIEADMKQKLEQYEGLNPLAYENNVGNEGTQDA